MGPGMSRCHRTARSDARAVAVHMVLLQASAPELFLSQMVAQLRSLPAACQLEACQCHGSPHASGTHLLSAAHHWRRGHAYADPQTRTAPRACPYGPLPASGCPAAPAGVCLRCCLLVDNSICRQQQRPSVGVSTSDHSAAARGACMQAWAEGWSDTGCPAVMTGARRQQTPAPWSITPQRSAAQEAPPPGVALPRELCSRTSNVSCACGLQPPVGALTHA